MCVIAIVDNKFNRKFNDLRAIMNKMSSWNSDGCGFAVVRASGVSFHKEVQYDAFVEKLKCEFDDWERIILHFRKASAGVVSSEMCHPFLISKKRSLYTLSGVLQKGEWLLFHNGHFSFSDKVEDLVTNDKNVSDTAILAKLISGLDVFTAVKILQAIERFQRMVFVDWKGNLYLIGEFEQYEGILCSNLSWVGVSIIPHRFSRWWNYKCDV